MPAARLRLLLPGLRPGAPAVDEAGMPSPLLRLLARAEWRASGESCRAALLEAFGYAADAAPAPLLALHDLDLDPAAGAGWLRADPVHFRADAKLVLMLAPATGELDAAEADEYLAALRAAIPEHDWRRGADPLRWYVRGPALEATPALGPAWLHGRSVTPFFPQDAAHRRWRQLMSEAQMVLHAAAPNARRAARGAAAVNAMWLWGGGATGPAAADEALPSAAVGVDLLLAGLARARRVRRHASIAPAALGAALAEGGVVAMCGAPYGATVDTPPTVAAEAAAWATWAWTALRAGDLAAVELIGEGLRGELRPAARWCPWRRRPGGRFADPHAVEAPP